jgi:hypothetical protein
MNQSDKKQISKWEELGWDSKEEYDKHLLQSGEIAKNDTPQMAKDRILSNFKIQLGDEEEKLKHHLDQSLNDDEIGDIKDYVEGLTKISGKNSKENEE